MYGDHVLTFLYRTCRLSSIWMENGAHFGRFATKAWRISKKWSWLSCGLLVRRPAKGGRAGGQPGPRFPGIRGFPVAAASRSLACLVESQDFPFYFIFHFFSTLWDNSFSIFFNVPVWIFFSISFSITIHFLISSMLSFLCAFLFQCLFPVMFPFLFPFIFGLLFHFIVYVSWGGPPRPPLS